MDRYGSAHKIELYLKYEEEMSRFFYANHELGSMEKRKEHANFYLGSPTHLWYDVLCRGENVGFFIIAITPPDAHPRYDFTILDAYMLPQFRRQGLFSINLIEFIKKNRGSYCLMTYKDNHIAKRVFDSIFINKLYYTPSAPKFTVHSRDYDFNTRMFGYAPAFRDKSIKI